jgi:hypothetical protein
VLSTGVDFAVQPGHPPRTFWHLLLVLFSPLTSLLSGLLRDDRDSKFTTHGDALLTDAGSKVIRLPAQSLNLNAYAERWIRTVREARSHLLRTGR